MVEVVKVGSEFLVNTQTAGDQFNPKITSLANGGFVVTWRDTNVALGDGSGSSIKAQVFGANRTKVGGEILVNTQASADQLRPTITGLAGGGFVVAWMDNSGTLGDGSSASIKAQTFTSGGVKVGAEFLVNTQTLNDQLAPTILGLPSGGFVVTWTDASGTLGDSSLTSIKAQVFGADGVRSGTEFLVNTETAFNQSLATITSLANGGFVITWEDNSRTLGDSDASSIKAQLFGANGTKVGAEFLVNTQTVSFQTSPMITSLANGGFVITWIDSNGTLGPSIKAQVFNSAGTKVGTEFMVNMEAPNGQSSPAITGLANGNFVVTWPDTSGTLGDSNGSSIKAQVFDASGTKIGAEFLVNTQTAGDQFIPAITALPNGGFAVTWGDQSGTLGDSSTSIKA